jgi:putative endonuclease
MNFNLFLTRLSLWRRINRPKEHIKMTYQKQLGDKGETIAAEYLQREKFQLLDKQYHTRFGEIDIVALDSDMIVFVEVKTRTSDRFGLPEESITPAKIEHLENAGLIWLQEHPDSPEDWRIDVISLLLDHQDQVLDLHHFKNVHL